MSVPEQRLFFAIWPDDATRRRLEDVVGQLPAHRGRAGHPLDWHITLVFLGRVEASRLPCVTEAADAVVAAPFRLRIDQLGYWRRPRIIWCAPSLVSDGLSRLVEDLSERLKSCGFKPEKRRYTPHLTLVRKARLIDGCELQPPLNWQARDFVLVASHSGKPPRYQVLQRWKLAKNSKLG